MIRLAQKNAAKYLAHYLCLVKRKDLDDVLHLFHSPTIALMGVNFQEKHREIVQEYQYITHQHYPHIPGANVSLDLYKKLYTSLIDSFREKLMADPNAVECYETILVSKQLDLLGSLNDEKQETPF